MLRRRSPRCKGRQKGIAARCGQRRVRKSVPVKRLKDKMPCHFVGRPSAVADKPCREKVRSLPPGAAAFFSGLIRAAQPAPRAAQSRVTSILAAGAPCNRRGGGAAGQAARGSRGVSFRINRRRAQAMSADHRHERHVRIASATEGRAALRRAHRAGLRSAHRAGRNRNRTVASGYSDQRQGSGRIKGATCWLQPRTFYSRVHLRQFRRRAAEISRQHAPVQGPRAGFSCTRGPPSGGPCKRR